MNLLSKLSRLNIIDRNYAWWKAQTSILNKIVYYFAIFQSYMVLISMSDRKIRYLGSNIKYDNYATPLSLMYYPHEITEKILSNLDEPISSLLDIGGNIGQFAITFSKLSPQTKIDIFEPNPTVFLVLKENTHHIKSISTYNFGVGPKETRSMFVSPKQTAIGSMIHSNSTTRNKDDIEQIKIQSTQNIGELTNRSNYDLIKIDVEGFELNVLQNMTGLKTKYLFIEMSGIKRDRDGRSSQVLAVIKDIFGDYDVLNISAANKNSMNYDLLLKF